MGLYLLISHILIVHVLVELVLELIDALGLYDVCREPEVVPIVNHSLGEEVLPYSALSPADLLERYLWPQLWKLAGSLAGSLPPGACPCEREGLATALFLFSLE